MGKNIKIEVTQNYLENILQALEDAKGLCEAYGFKNTYSKHINRTKKYLDITNNKIVVKPEIPKRSGRDLVDIVNEKYKRVYGED